MTTDSDVIVVVPAEITSTHIIPPSGKPAMVDVDAAGRRIIQISAADARLMISGGTSDTSKWWAVNQQLAPVLGPLRREPGVNVAAVLEAARPRSVVDIIRDARSDIAARWRTR